MPLYKAWDVKRETRKAVVAGSFKEFAKAGELFCCLISEIQSDMYSECLQRGYDTIILSLTTGRPDVEYDYNNILAVYKTMYENASKITLNAMCRK